MDRAIAYEFGDWTSYIEGVERNVQLMKIRIERAKRDYDEAVKTLEIVREAGPRHRPILSSIEQAILANKLLGNLERLEKQLLAGIPHPTDDSVSADTHTAIAEAERILTLRQPHDIVAVYWNMRSLMRIFRDIMVNNTAVRSVWLLFKLSLCYEAALVTMAVARIMIIHAKVHPLPRKVDVRATNGNLHLVIDKLNFISLDDDRKREVEEFKQNFKASPSLVSDEVLSFQDEDVREA